MWFNRYRVSILLVLVFAVLGSTLALYRESQESTAIAFCQNEFQNDEEKINCWYDLIRKKFSKEGTEAAFTLFERIYRDYDTFSNTGCHRHAHNVGDMAYYFDYLNHEDITKTEFPRNASTCGYGFYHGFFEHLIQGNPRVEFVTEICEYAKVALLPVAPAIAQTCYHGSGHGFVLAEAGRLTNPEDWNIKTFTGAPLNSCESLPEAGEKEIKECRQGVYNVLVDWMADEEYGLSYDSEKPFAVCDLEKYDRQPDCYYEMSQKLDGVSGQDPIKAVAIANSAKRADLRGSIVSVALAGMVQHDPKGDQNRLLLSCQGVIGVLKDSCIAGIVGGLIEHNTALGDYSNALNFCAGETLNEDESKTCYRALGANIQRFKTLEELGFSCKKGQYPEAMCSQILTL